MVFPYQLQNIDINSLFQMIQLMRLGTRITLISSLISTSALSRRETPAFQLEDPFPITLQKCADPISAALNNNTLLSASSKYKQELLFVLLQDMFFITTAHNYWPLAVY